MNRQLITQSAKDNLGEFKGDPMAGSPYQWPAIVTRAANYVASRLRCIYGFAAQDIVSGQSQYGSGTSYSAGSGVVYEIRNVSVYTADGLRHTIPPISIEKADADFSQWRDQVSGRLPTVYLPLSMTQIVLYPAPNYNYTAGIVLEGLWMPGLSWPNDTSECPLPTALHDLVIDYATILRIRQDPTPDNKMRLIGFQQSFQDGMDFAESNAIMFTQATRSPAYISGIGTMPTSGADNPLNMV